MINSRLRSKEVEMEAIKSINLNTDLNKYISNMKNSGYELEKWFISINVHIQSKIQYLPVDNELSPVMTGLSNNKELTHFAQSLKYRLESIYFQSQLIEVITKSTLEKFNIDPMDNENSNLILSYHLQLNTLLDNLIIYDLSLIEYSLTFFSHLCFKKIINDWKSFQSKVKTDSKSGFILPFLSKYNKSIIALKIYRNDLVHKSIVGFPFGTKIQFMSKDQNEFCNFNIGISTKLRKMCKEFIFNNDLDFDNLITLHFSVTTSIFNMCAEFFQILFHNLYDSELKPKFFKPLVFKKIQNKN